MVYADDIFENILKVISARKETNVNAEEYISTDDGSLDDEEADREILQIPSMNDRIVAVSFSCRGKDGIRYVGLYGVYSYYENFYPDGGSSWQFEGLIVKIKVGLSTPSSIQELNTNIEAIESHRKDVVDICREAEKLINTHTFAVPATRVQKGAVKVTAVSKEDALKKFQAMSKEEKEKAFFSDGNGKYITDEGGMYQED